LKATKPTRLYFKSFIKALYNSVGSNLFRSFYVSTPEEGEFDALKDGQDSCAFYVSSILVIFHKIKIIHGTVNGLKRDLIESGWVNAKRPKIGDVLIWEAKEFNNNMQQHSGFYLGNNKAISMSYTKKVPQIHDINFENNRKVKEIYHLKDWDYLF